jgi:ABC-type transport system involved in cytochrome c biogenesis permease subunit
MNAKTGRWIVFFMGLLGLVGLVYLVYKDSTPEGEVRNIAAYTPWQEETIDKASLLPVQDGGRVKPLGTYAGFTMLGLHGQRSMDIIGKDGEKIRLKPLDWMLDCLFRPELAKELPTFRLDNADVLKAIGVATKDRRDRYSYNDIAPQVEKLKQFASSYNQIPAANRKTIETQTIELYSNVATFEALANYMKFAREGLLPGSAQREGGKVLPISEVMGAASKIRQAVADFQQKGTPLPEQVQTIQTLIVERANESNFGLKLFPPSNKDDPTWVSAGDRMFNIFTGETREPEQSVKDVKLLEETVQALATGEGAFRDKFAALEDSIVARAKERGEYRSIPLEADYFRKNWLVYALVFFLLATVCSGVMLFTGESKVGKISYWATVSFLSLGLIYVIIPIVKRCIIMQRPPVGNLYDTIIFIDMALVIFALLVLWMSKKKFVLGIAPIGAAFLIVLARRFEVGEGKDHLDPLIAVLRSNFWLSTHVITITLGYASGLIAALISISYVMLRVLGLDEGDATLRRSITRAAYGCLCLTLVLSLIGTVLGGIWANDSWGRFWGWDPKENGALMIVLWTLAILHARLGGFIKEWGLHMASIFGAVIVAFSWWGVNFLSVGLHNYGFSDSKKGALHAFYGAMLFFMAVAAVGWWIDRMKKGKAVEKVTELDGKKAEA